MTIEGRAAAIDAADTDGDGLTDLVVGGGDTVTVLRATATGGFTPVWSDDVNNPVLDVATLDAHSDGDRDVAVVWKLPRPDVEWLYLYENLGTGQLGAPQAIVRYNIASGVTPATSPATATTT